MFSIAFFKKFGWLFLLIALSAIAHWQWIVLPGIFTSGDFGYTSTQIFSESLTSPKILDTTTSLSTGISQPTFALLFFIGGLLAKIHLGFAEWERIIFLWPIAIFAPIPIYLLLLKTLKYPAGAFAGSMIYIFNTYILAREMMHLHIAIVYFLAPLLFMTVRDLLHKQTTKSILFFIAVTGVCSIYEMRILYTLTFMLVAYSLYLLISRKITLSWKMLRVILYAIIPVALLQSYWLIPFIFANSSLAYESFVSRELFRSYDHIPQAITLYDPFWSGEQLTDFIPQPIPRWEYLLPIIAFLWLVLRPKIKKNSYFWFWSIVAIVGIFLVKQENNPFPNAYSWLYYHFPGFNFFRESSKLKIIIALAFSMLTAGSLLLLQSRLKKVANALILALSVIMLINILPLTTGSIKAMTTPHTIDDQFLTTNNALESDSTFGRTLWVPGAERFITASQTHPRLSLANLMGSDWKSYALNQNDPLSITSEHIFKALINFASIGYVGEPTNQIDNVYQLYNASKETIGKNLINIKNLQPTTWAPPDMPIWANPDAKPHAYIADNVVSVHGALQDYSGSDPSIHSAFVFQPDVPSNLFQRIEETVATNIEYIPFLPENILIKNGTITPSVNISATSSMQTVNRSSNQDIITDAYIEKTDQDITLIIKKDGTNQTLAQIPNSHQDLNITINDVTRFYNSQTTDPETLIGQVRLRSGDNSIKFYGRIATDPLIKNSSFESGTWGDAGDCNNIDGTSAQTNKIIASQSDTATNGQYSLLLTAGKHIACTASTIASTDAPTTYFGSLDYQLKNGTPGYIKVFVSNPTKEVASVQFADQSGWQNANFSFEIDQPQSLTMYLYQPSASTSTSPSAGLFDNIHLDAYQGIASITVTLPTPAELTTAPYQPSDTIISNPEITGENIIQQANLIDPAPIPGDCYNSDGTPAEKNGIGSSIINSPNNSQALSVTAKKHIACITFPLKNFDPTYDYLLNINYKTVSGDNAHITLYPNKAGSNATVQLFKTNGQWQTKNVILSGKGIPPRANLILYIPTDAGPAESQFSKISLTKIPILPQRFIQTTNPVLPDVQTQGQDFGPTMRILQVDDIGNAKRLLVLSDRYSSGWKVFVRPKNTANQNILKRALLEKPGVEISADSHIKANGFTNGWIIDPAEIESALGSTKDFDIIIEYLPQRYMDAGTLIALATGGIFIVVFLITFVLKNLTHRESYTTNRQQP